MLVPPSSEQVGIDSHDAGGSGVSFSRVSLDEARNRGSVRSKPQTLSEDIIDNINMHKVQETIKEFAPQMHPTQATVLQLLRQREEELRATEIVSLVDAAKDKKKKIGRADSESDTSSSSESASDSDTRQTILKRSKNCSRVIGTQHHITCYTAGLQ